MANNHSSNTTQWIGEYLYYGDPIVITFVTILSILMVIAILGNLLVLMTIALKREMRTHTNILLANLAVADILVAAVLMPLAINTLINGTWIYSHALCMANAVTVGVGWLVSAHTLMWISIHKCIGITQPISKRITQGQLVFMICLVWGWSILYSITPVIGWTDTIYIRGASQCGPTTPVTMLQKSHGLTNTIFNQMLAISVTTYCYYRIFREVNTNTIRLQAIGSNVQNSLIQQKRLSITLLIVVSCFALMWTPYIIYSNLLISLGNEAVSEILNPISYLFGYMNSACNPIIYALRLPSFRQGYQEILCGRKKVSGALSTVRRVASAVGQPSSGSLEILST